jgi:rRNA-processing protein EBP2
VAVDNEISKPGRNGFGSSSNGKRRGAGDGPSSTKRRKRDEKYGYGGSKRHAKSNDAISTGDMGGFRGRRAAGGPKRGGGSGGVKKTPRLGKSRRQAAAGKR